MVRSNVKELMKEKKVTYHDLIKSAGVSMQTVRNARGPEISKCKLQTLEAIAAALGVPVNALFEEVKAVSD